MTVGLKVNLYLLGEADGRTHYVEEPVGDNQPMLGTLSVESAVLPQPAPPVIEVSVRYREAAGAATPVDLSRFVPPPREALKAGDKVTIVKDRVSGIRSPPEWLEQYLGRTGRILWTTAGGAMVKLDKGATWFPYSELERADQR
jgi:hypothetical protein